MENRPCPICKFEDTQEIHSNFPGYIQGTTYKIFCCKNCNTQFIPIEDSITEIYNIIYKQQDTPGYQRYYNYAKKVKKLKNPLKFLSQQEPSYFPIYQLVKQERKRIKILEVGCGYGYLTYSLHSLGYDVTGIDISKDAINFAKHNFGSYFSLNSIDTLKKNERFDLIIANELIEHLEDPNNFIKICKSLLSPKGKIVLATPNKNYYKKDSIWKTDLPPVHTVWLSKESIEALAEQYNLSCDFTDFTNYICEKQNSLVTYCSSRINISKLPPPVLNKAGKPLKERMDIHNSTFRKAVKSLLFFYPIRFISHYLYYLVKKESPTIGAIIKK